MKTFVIADKNVDSYRIGARAVSRPTVERKMDVDFICLVRMRSLHAENICQRINNKSIRVLIRSRYV